MQRGIRFLIDNSLFLLVGAVVGLILANTAPGLYHDLSHPLHFPVNDVAMTIFFLLAGKEIREAMLPGGPLSNVRTAGLPLLATAGGMAGPAVIFSAGAILLAPNLLDGWAVPTATDIAFSYLVARFIFGTGHPAIPFLLLLAIADDAGGLLILAVFYPQGELNLPVFGVLAGVAVAVALVMWRRLKVLSFWWYLAVPGVLAWWGFYLGGLHPALALVPLAWCMPHAKSDLGPFAEMADGEKVDTLNQLQRWWQNPVELVLGLFGFVNAGVQLSAVGVGTWLVFAGLVVGKPIGIVLLSRLGLMLGLKLPESMGMRELLVVGCTAGIGFTVALFVSTVAFPPGADQDAVKTGALLSFASAPIAILAARTLRTRRIAAEQPPGVDVAPATARET